MVAFYGFVAAAALWGLLNVVFAFVEPPGPLARLFRVPAIFVFLPERWVMPAGRLFVALCCFFVAGMMVWRIGIP